MAKIAQQRCADGEQINRCIWSQAAWKDNSIRLCGIKQASPQPSSIVKILIRKVAAKLGEVDTEFFTNPSEQGFFTCSSNVQL